jgi:NAD(P)H-dependent flavin oxidoreductase YrpB (nitropropane dioxygenase family)
MGQGCGGIEDLPSAGEIVRRVVEEAQLTLSRLQPLIGEADMRGE